MKSVYLIILLIIISSYFRFTNLSNWGLLLYDEGRYVSEAKYTKDVLSWFSKFVSTVPFSENKARLVREQVKSFKTDHLNPVTARPLHNVLASIGYFLSPKSSNPGNFVSAFFGVLTVLLTYLFSILITKSKPISFLSALILSILPLHIIYSRSLLAEVDSQFFFLISLIIYSIYFKNRVLWLFALCGFFIGLAFVTNGDRFAFFTLLILETIIRKKDSLKSNALFLVFFIIPFFLAEMPYHIGFLLTNHYQMTPGIPTYWEQVLWNHTRLLSFTQSKSLTSFLSYPTTLINLGGITFFSSIILGIIWMIKNRKLQVYWIILVPVITTLLFQSAHGLQASRGISPLLPLLSIIASIGILKIKDIFLFLRKKSFSKQPILQGNRLYILLVLILASELIYKSHGLLSYKTNMPEAISFLKVNNAKAVLTTSDILLTAYDPTTKTINYQINSGKFNSLSELNNQGFLLTNIQKYTISTKARGLRKQLGNDLTLIEQKCTPIFNKPEISNRTLIDFYAFEHNVSLSETLNFIGDFDTRTDGNIRIYDYKSCLEKINQN